MGSLMEIEHRRESKNSLNGICFSDAPELTTQKMPDHPTPIQMPSYTAWDAEEMNDSRMNDSRRMIGPNALVAVCMRLACGESRCMRARGLQVCACRARRADEKPGQ